MFVFRDRWGIVPIVEYSNTLSSRLSDRSVHIVYVWGVGLLWIAISNIHGFICSVKTMISVSKLFWILFSGSAIFIIHIVHAIFVSTGIELRDLSAHARSALLQNVFFLITKSRRTGAFNLNLVSEQSIFIYSFSFCYSMYNFLLWYDLVFDSDEERNNTHQMMYFMNYFRYRFF